MFVLFVLLYLVKTNDASERTLRRDVGGFPFALSLNRNLATSLKAYLYL